MLIVAQVVAFHVVLTVNTKLDYQNLMQFKLFLHNSYFGNTESSKVEGKEQF